MDDKVQENGVVVGEISLNEIVNSANRAFEFDNWEDALRLYKIVESYHNEKEVVNIGHVYCRLGALYRKGRNGKKDLKRAEYYFKLALSHLPIREKEEDPEAICDLGYLHNYGYGVEEDKAKAVHYYTIAANKGYARAQSNLAYMLLYGHGIEENKAKSLKFYQLAANQGYVLAYSSLGYMYELGYGDEGMTQDPKKAVEYYKIAADQGYALAQYNLGYMYDNASGVPEDKQMALKYYLLASAQGNAEALCNLGYMYENGLGGLKEDKMMAVKYYQMAADSEYELAQYNLGCMYNNGFGGKRDQKLSAKFYMLSAMQGYESAQKYLVEILCGDAGKDFQIVAIEYLSEEWTTLYKILHPHCHTTIQVLFCVFKTVTVIGDPSYIPVELVNLIAQWIVKIWPDHHYHPIKGKKP